MRAIVQAIIPFLLPFALYFAWAWLRQRRSGQAPGHASPGEVMLRQAPWAALTVAGTVLTAIGLLWFAELTAMDPADSYAPARMVDGRIVEGGARPATP